MEKKNIAITVLIVALIGSGVGNIVLVIIASAELPPSRSDAYIRSTSSGPHTLEITDSWDSASNDVLEQVVETLFAWDLTDPDLPRVNLLAESYFWEDLTTLQIKLREGVLFHDNTSFNAVAAKWNLDRLNFLINATGTRTTGDVAHTQCLWMFPNGTTPIMNNTATVGDYNITITLNGAYAPFMSALTYINAGMISPTAHEDDEESFIPLTTGDVIGTGPFTYDSFVPNVEVRLSRWNDYWMKDLTGASVIAHFHTVIYAIYSDATTAHNAFIGYTIDANGMASDQNLAFYDTDPKLHVERLPTASLVYQYLGFNNNKYNVTWREAMSYAINYTYVIDEMRLGNAYRAVSPISPGFGAAYNTSVEALAPTYDIAHARSVMNSMGFGNAFTTDAEWIAVAEGTSPFLSILNTYNTGNTFRENMFVALNSWFKLIGIEVEDDGVTWDEFLNYLFDDFDHLGIFAIGWAPDYLDPYNMIDPLFNPVSGSNSGQVNDTHLMDKLGLALGETDDDARNIIYKDIQWYMATQGFFHAPLYHSKVTSCHGANIYGVPYNAMGTLRIFPMYRGLYPA